MAPLAAALAERLRARALELAGHAYANISPAKLAALLGCSEAEAAAGAASAGPPPGEQARVDGCAQRQPVC